MKNRTRKKQLSIVRKSRSAFVKSTLRGLLESRAGKFSPYMFGSDNHASHAGHDSVVANSGVPRETL